MERKQLELCSHLLTYQKKKKKSSAASNISLADIAPKNTFVAFPLAKERLQFHLVSLQHWMVQDTNFSLF